MDVGSQAAHISFNQQTGDVETTPPVSRLDPGPPLEQSLPVHLAKELPVSFRLLQNRLQAGFDNS